ncbi:hypothetical protein AB0I81_32140 [Nonomuraea sp. NPDC050404]|uniref:hypothetical protein n=1 Tax=Nonomuraea sp. NPDC050404 TaxID=3155783 RepID=UPI00340A6725
MEGDHRVWPPEPEPGRGRPPEPPPGWGRRGRPYSGGPAAGAPQEPGRGRTHPMDLEEPAWSPRIRPGPDRGRSAEAWEDLPPSARLHGSPADPKPPRGRHGGGTRRRVTMVLVALAAGAGLVTGTTAVTLWLTTPRADTGNLSDALAGVRATLPDGWSTGPVAPVTGFTSVVRDGQGGLVMARPVPGPIPDPERATADAAELYSRLLLKGDRVSVVEDRQIPGGHTRAIRAEYSDVVNRPAYLRVMLLTRADRPVLLVGLLQPEQNSRRQALDAVMTSLR